MNRCFNIVVVSSFITVTNVTRKCIHFQPPQNLLSTYIYFFFSFLICFREEKRKKNQSYFRCFSHDLIFNWFEIYLRHTGFVIKSKRECMNEPMCSWYVRISCRKGNYARIHRFIPQPQSLITLIISIHTEFKYARGRAAWQPLTPLYSSPLT